MIDGFRVGGEVVATSAIEWMIQDFGKGRADLGISGAIFLCWGEVPWKTAGVWGGAPRSRTVLLSVPQGLHRF